MSYSLVAVHGLLIAVASLVAERRLWVFADVSLGLAGWIPVFVMIASAIIMLICGALKIFLKAKWIEDYALPISLLGGMALSLPITDLVNSLV